jgi:tetratricopeptide (TPR) repeat protein
MSRYGIDWSNRKSSDDFTEEEFDIIFAETTKIIENDDTETDIASAYYDRGIIYIKWGDYEKAIFDFTSALQLHFQHPGTAHYNRGLACYMIKKTESALSDFNEAKCFYPDDKDTLYMIDLISKKR